MRGFFVSLIYNSPLFKKRSPLIQRNYFSAERGGPNTPPYNDHKMLYQYENLKRMQGFWIYGRFSNITNKRIILLLS